MNMRTFSCSYILLLLCFEVDERFRLLLLFNNFLITSMVKKKNQYDLRDCATEVLSCMYYTRHSLDTIVVEYPY